jgi:hypothetical protein
MHVGKNIYQISAHLCSSGPATYPWFDIVECNITWYLSHGIANGKDGVDLIELVPLEVELLLHP